MSSFTEAVQTAKDVIEAVEKRQAAEKAKAKAAQTEKMQQQVDKLTADEIRAKKTSDLSWVWWLVALWALSKGR